jgi:hypothetical protein
VFAEHSVPLLRRMSAELPQAVAVTNDDVVGYCLSLSLMFDQFSRCDYHGRPLSERGKKSATPEAWAIVAWNLAHPAVVG